MNTNPLFTLSVNEFSDLVRELLKTQQPPITANPIAESSQPERLNFEQAAKYLKISKPTFSNLRKAGVIQSYQLSKKRVIFLRDDLDKYIKSKKLL